MNPEASNFKHPNTKDEKLADMFPPPGAKTEAPEAKSDPVREYRMDASGILHPVEDRLAGADEHHKQLEDA